MEKQILNQGYCKLIAPWGSDEEIIEAARMSTNKGFMGWGGKCPNCPGITQSDPNITTCINCGGTIIAAGNGDEKLLRYLWENKHATPFEMAGATFEIKAPIMVFREHHRHRTQSYNEMSARYVPLPDENYVPSIERLLQVNVQTANKQATGVVGVALDEYAAQSWLVKLEELYAQAQQVYELGMSLGIAKELARLPVPVARYSKMRASANLRNWLAFLTLRMAPNAQWEIRQYAEAIHEMLTESFPRTMQLFDEGRMKPNH